MRILFVALSLFVSGAACADDAVPAEHASLAATELLAGIDLFGPHLKLKYFEPRGRDDGTSGDAGLGVSYNFSRTLTSIQGNEAKDARGVQTDLGLFKLDFAAEGNVAFDADINPSDFLKTGLNFDYLRSHVGGYGPPPAGCDPTRIEDATSPDCQKITIKSAYRIEVGVIGSLESDQRFNNKAYTYGAQIGFVFMPSVDSVWSQLNPLEAVFRMLRSVTAPGASALMEPSPNSFPALRLRYEQVDPTDDEQRQAIQGGGDSYGRLGLELGFATVLAKVQGASVGLDLGWRYFKEPNAAAGIEDADLDEFSYFAASLALDAGWRLTYSSGRLPFDRVSDQVWELGYRLNLD